MKISIIAAVASNNVIGLANHLPWYLRSDLQRFKRLTMGNPIIMGRRTFESIGRPLPGRQNIVLTTDPSYPGEGITLVHTLEEALREAEGAPEAFVIGGATLYGQALPRADLLYWTQVEAEVAGDTYFPDVDWEQWVETSRDSVAQDEHNQYPATFFVYERKSAHNFR